MNDPLSKLSRDYARALQKYLAAAQEAVLEQAYDLGRRAVARGLGVLDLARIHRRAMEKLVDRPAGQQELLPILKTAEAFFLQALSPFEMIHRGFGETNFKLQQLVVLLRRRNRDLAEMNRDLEREVTERRRTEQALRESEEHFRALFHQARLMEENLRNLSNQILHAQEKERERISRELHDEVGQALTGINFNLATIKNNGADSAHDIREKVADAQELLQQTMETVHRFARELRPAMLDELGLLPTLRSYFNAFAGRTGVRVRFGANPLAEKLGAEQKTVVFRVAQESLTNVAKHAHASRVSVWIRKLKDGICMEIADNGKSFKEDPIYTAKSKKRLGLVGMQERVRLVNGQFLIKPQPGKGTTVRVVIPFHSKNALTLPNQHHD
jgi:signal transduction histidine kinase